MNTHYEFGFMHVVLNNDNGEIRYFNYPNEVDEYYQIYLASDVEFNKPIEKIEYTSSSYSKVTLSLNISCECNFRCKYCFSDHQGGLEYTKIEEILSLIDRFVFLHQNKNSIFIDLSGSGEPLLYFDKIKRIADFVILESQKYNTNVILQFVTNGYLLTQNIVNPLQKLSVLFGVSLDGTKDYHNRNRLLQNGSPTYDVIVKNLSNIKEKEYLGTAMVLDGSFDVDLLDCYLNMNKYSPTVSVKFKRSDTKDEFKNQQDYIIREYFKVVIYMLKKITEENDFNLIFAILNGDDSFGTLLSRIIIENKVYSRCDGGIARFSYSKKKELYPCAPSIFIKEFNLDDKNNIYDKTKKIDYCSNCQCKYYCGGECPIVKLKLSNNDIYLCNIKRKLLEYSIFFKSYLLIENIDAYNKIYQYIIEKESR